MAKNKGDYLAELKERGIKFTDDTTVEVAKELLKEANKAEKENADALTSAKAEVDTANKRAEEAEKRAEKAEAELDELKKEQQEKAEPAAKSEKQPEVSRSSAIALKMKAGLTKEQAIEALDRQAAHNNK